MDGSVDYYGGGFKVILDKFNFYAPILLKHISVRHPMGR